MLIRTVTYMLSPVLYESTGQLPRHSSPYRPMTTTVHVAVGMIVSNASSVLSSLAIYRLALSVSDVLELA